MTDEYICKDCGHRAGDHAVNNRCLNCDCVADPYLEQLVALRAELVEWKSAHDNLAMQLSCANDEVESAHTKLDIAVEATKALLYVAEMRRNWDILSSDDFDEAYPDECGWAFGDVDENMIQKMEMAQKALAAIERIGKDE